MTRRILAVVGMTVLALALAACGSDSATSASASASSSASASAEGEVVRMWIAPELVECEGVGPMQCMQVAYTEDGEPELFYSAIDGFRFVEGTTYVVDVRVTPVENPPADGSSRAYTLVEVVSERPAP